MASIAAGYNKKGELFYIIRVSRGRGMKLATDRFYPTANGHRIRQESRKTDAMAFYYSKEFEDRVKKGALSPIEAGDTGIALPGEETLQQIGDKFMIEMDSLGYAGKTQANYKAILKKFVYPALGGYSPSHLTEPVCEDFLKGISSKYGENASKRARMVLCTTFDYEINAGQIEENPVERIKLKEAKFRARHRLKKREAETPKVYTMEQIEELGRVMQKQPLKWRVYYSILIETGIRRGECCALRWKNVDFDTGRLCIDQSCNYTPDKGIFFDSPKNGKTRIVLISPETIDLMKELRKSQEKCPSVFVFTRRNGSDVMSPNVATEYFHELEVKHSLSFHCSPHKFRHTFASLAATNNTSPVTLSALLGHTDQRASRRYTHPYTEAEEAAAKGVIELVERRFPLITKSEESLAKTLRINGKFFPDPQPAIGCIK